MNPSIKPLVIDDKITHGINENARCFIFVITFSSKGDWQVENALHNAPIKNKVIMVIIT